MTQAAVVLPDGLLVGLHDFKVLCALGGPLAVLHDPERPQWTDPAPGPDQWCGQVWAVWPDGTAYGFYADPFDDDRSDLYVHTPDAACPVLLETLLEAPTPPVWADRALWTPGLPDGLVLQVPGQLRFEFAA